MPFDELKQVEQLKQMYEQGFANILKLLNNSPDEAYYRDILVNIREILNDLDANADKVISKLISQTYSYNAAQTREFLKSLGKQQQPNFAQIHQRAVDVLAQNLSDNLRNATQYVGRRIEDTFRQVALETAGEKYTMGATIEDMRDKLVQRLVDRGYTAFVDRLGRKWRLDTYAEMVARTITREAASVAVLNECEEFDIDLVMFSTHKPTCEICAPLQGKVYSISGNDKRYPKLTDEIRPPVHPNCRHSIQPYVRELDDNAEETQRRSNEKPKGDPRPPAEQKAYKATQKAPGAIEEIMRNPQIQQFGQPEREELERELKSAPPDFVKVVQKSISKLNLRIKTDPGVSCYWPGAKAIDLRFGETPEETMRAFWHEYGHFIDDIRANNGLKLEEGNNEGITPRVLLKHEFYKIRQKDAQHFLGDKYEVSGNKIYYNGEHVTERPELRGQLAEYVDDKIERDIGRDAPEKFLRAQGIPKSVEIEDYFIYYPGKGMVEKYAGAEEEYNRRRAEYLQAIKRITPEMQKEIDRLRQEYEINQKLVGGITDSLDALVNGELDLRRKWGAHDPYYYQRDAATPVSESWANWFQIQMQQRFPDLYKKYMPNLDAAFRESWGELLNQTFGG